MQAITLHNAHPASDKARQQLPSAYPYARPACTSTQQKTKVLQEPVNQTGLLRHRKEYALRKPKRYSGLPTNELSKKGTSSCIAPVRPAFRPRGNSSSKRIIWFRRIKLAKTNNMTSLLPLSLRPPCAAFRSLNGRLMMRGSPVQLSCGC